MHEVQVQVLEPELLERLGQGRFDGVGVTVVVIPQLARHPDVFALQAGLIDSIGDSFPDGNLVAVGGGGVDVAVAGLDS